MPALSVIVPVYNAAAYLRECVDSILAQTFADIEVILVDDGSTDDSPAICREYADSDGRVRVVSRTNGGLSAARNSGLKVAKGDFITFVDADDAILPNFCEKLMNALRESGADVAACDFYRGKDFFIPRKKDVAPEFIDGRDALFLILYQKRLNNSAWSKIFRCSLFVENGIEFVEGLYYEDLEIIPRLYDCAMHGVAVIDEPLYFYRDNASSFLSTFSEHRLDVLTVTDSLEKRYSSDRELAAAARSRKLSANFNMFVLGRKHGRSDVADRCWKVIKEYRAEALCDSKVRLKNKAGALLSYLGPEIFYFIGRLFY